jgi:hypothetical protein
MFMAVIEKVRKIYSSVVEDSNLDRPRTKAEIKNFQWHPKLQGQPLGARLADVWGAAWVLEARGYS